MLIDTEPASPMFPPPEPDAELATNESPVGFNVSNVKPNE